MAWIAAQPINITGARARAALVYFFISALTLWWPSGNLFVRAWDSCTPLLTSAKE